MALMDAFIPEIEAEAKLTRKVLERVPDEKFGYQPHPKSMTLGALASHIAETYSWAPSIVPDEFVLDMATYKPYAAENKAALLAAFDANVEEALAAVRSIDDGAARATWRMKDGEGNVMIAMDRMALVRFLFINHTIHHRAQLGVYLRMNDVPLPAIYGPTADEMP